MESCYSVVDVESSRSWFDFQSQLTVLVLSLLLKIHGTACGVGLSSAWKSVSIADAMYCFVSRVKAFYSSSVK